MNYNKTPTPLEEIPTQAIVDELNRRFTQFVMAGMTTGDHDPRDVFFVYQGGRNDGAAGMLADFGLAQCLSHTIWQNYQGSREYFDPNSH